MTKVQKRVKPMTLQKPCQIWLQEMLLCVSEQTLSVNQMYSLCLIKRCHWGCLPFNQVWFPRCHTDGGSESSITPLPLLDSKHTTALSTTEDQLIASIPFDKDRNGLSWEKGSGMLVLESLEHAEKRGATILAEVVGYGSL